MPNQTEPLNGIYFRNCAPRCDQCLPKGQRARARNNQKRIRLPKWTENFSFCPLIVCGGGGLSESFLSILIWRSCVKHTHTHSPSLRALSLGWNDENIAIRMHYLLLISLFAMATIPLHFACSSESHRVRYRSLSQTRFPFLFAHFAFFPRHHHLPLHCLRG